MRPKAEDHQPLDVSGAYYKAEVTEADLAEQQATEPEDPAEPPPGEHPKEGGTPPTQKKDEKAEKSAAAASERSQRAAAAPGASLKGPEAVAGLTIALPSC